MSQLHTSFGHRAQCAAGRWRARGDASGRVFFHPGNYESWREYHAGLREKAGLPPIEAVGAHRKFSGS